MIRPIRIFLSSPGDVREERTRIREELLGLARSPFVRGRVLIDVVSWDDPYAPAVMDARLTPQQAVDRSLPLPADCDLTIVVLWSRMGTPLTETKPNGAPYRSGTEWEMENAIAAGKPVYLYRRTDRVLVDPEDPQFEDKVFQKRAVDEFFRGLQGPDGTCRHGYSTYVTPAELVTRVRHDVEQFLSSALGQGMDPLETSSRPSAPADLDVATHPLTSARPASIANPPLEPTAQAEPDPWSNADSQSVRLFLADAGFDEGPGPAVFACVVVEERATYERQWEGALDALLEDPQLQAIPGVIDAIRRRRFAYRTADPALREEIARILQGLVFEAYVGYTRERGGSDDRYAHLVRAVVFDRLRSHRSRAVTIALTMRDESRRSDALAAVTSSGREVRRLHGDAGRALPEMVAADWTSPGPTIAEYIAEITRDRLARGADARTFNLVHPNKIRVLYDLDTRRYYTRADPFPG